MRTEEILCLKLKDHLTDRRTKMSEIIDLNILFEKDEKPEVSFTSKDGQEFTLKLELNSEIALKSIKDLREGKTEMEGAASTLSELIRHQLKKDIKEQWIIKNIDWKILLYISRKLSDEIHTAIAIINGDNSVGSSKKK